MASAAEAELGSIFVNAQDAALFRTTFSDTNHQKPTTLIKLDNSTPVGIFNEAIKQRNSKATDMIFYWIRFRIKQDRFIVY